jgi:hypothetical protein
MFVSRLDESKWFSWLIFWKHSTVGWIVCRKCKVTKIIKIIQNYSKQSKIFQRNPKYSKIIHLFTISKFLIFWLCFNPLSSAQLGVKDRQAARRLLLLLFANWKKMSTHLQQLCEMVGSHNQAGTKMNLEQLITTCFEQGSTLTYKTSFDLFWTRTSFQL